MDEIVFAVKVSELAPDGNMFQGYQVPADPTILRKIYSNNIAMSRRDCENNPKFKHLIPYTMITSEDNQIFVVKRTANQTETRLHNLYSIGIGGHVGPQRLMTSKDAIHAGMLRELKEEITGVEYVGESLDFTPKLIGLLNDDSNEVGSVHLGLVYELLVDPDRIHSINVKEIENMTGTWMHYDEALQIKDYESWSALILGV